MIVSKLSTKRTKQNLFVKKYYFISHWPKIDTRYLFKKLFKDRVFGDPGTACDTPMAPKLREALVLGYAGRDLGVEALDSFGTDIQAEVMVINSCIQEVIRSYHLHKQLQQV